MEVALSLTSGRAAFTSGGKSCKNAHLTLKLKPRFQIFGKAPRFGHTLNDGFTFPVFVLTHLQAFGRLDH